MNHIAVVVVRGPLTQRLAFFALRTYAPETSKPYCTPSYVDVQLKTPANKQLKHSRLSFPGPGFRVAQQTRINSSACSIILLVSSCLYIYIYIYIYIFFHPPIYCLDISSTLEISQIRGHRLGSSPPHLDRYMSFVFLSRVGISPPFARRLSSKFVNSLTQCAFSEEGIHRSSFSTDNPH